ncbi:hypothetical protein TraAM80_08679 [Trypanosoma rangeli]|uniref:Uncharacterized protein n=1 Tax=Trypanosoma rangeli TaxID=5698 RepID=A0A3R7KP65_TRYRA|nr:uncharacterized protein TraAM80_08679 [Trypanosoma rangeli]RNE98577.1 hypothetical protein TraAM80_08679 [Trypanosoma rangeli]|eukprot:RNE98577.1 hypothetical protein TraAM80_08679 [Trypanosoma rangeli]
MQRFTAGHLLPVSAALVFSRRAASHDEIGDKKRKVNLDDDDRWLEAEFDEKNRTPEERYAHERQRELLKSILRKVDEKHHAKHNKLHSKVEDHHEEIEKIKSQMNALEMKLKELSQDK